MGGMAMWARMAQHGQRPTFARWGISALPAPCLRDPIPTNARGGPSRLHNGGRPPRAIGMPL